MTEIATPTLPFATIFKRPNQVSKADRKITFPFVMPFANLFPHPLRNPSKTHSVESQQEGLEVTWAKHLSEVRDAQALRYKVFVGEMGANIKTSFLRPNLDIDRFDDVCEHLLVRDLKTQQVVGTYRLLTPLQAKRVGGFYTETEFNLTALNGLKHKSVELGRSCVHPDFRHGGVIMALGRELFQFMARNQYEAMFGCASIPLTMGVDQVSGIWHQVARQYSAEDRLKVTPRLPFPLEEAEPSLKAELPAMLKGYLRLGAKVLGQPAWDPQFNTADLPIMAAMRDLPPRYRKHFEIEL
jgi:putative hemolysin